MNGRPGFYSFPRVAGLLRHEGCNSFVQPIPARTNGGHGVTVVELAPPSVETPLLRGEFAEEMKEQKGMDVRVLARHAIAGIEAGKLEIRPGLANVLKAMSRIAPQFMLKQMAKMAKPKRVSGQPMKKVSTSS